MRYTDPAVRTILEYSGPRLISRAFTGDTAAMEFLQTVLFDTAPGYTALTRGIHRPPRLKPQEIEPMANPTRLITIAPAAPGWWAKFKEDNLPTWFEPIAFWQMVEEYEEDSRGHIVPDANRLRMVQGVSPVGGGWAGESVEDYASQFKGYFFDPDLKEPFFEANFGASDEVAK